ncbi:RNA polymerase I associated factor, A49-like protein [Trichodelitschia bisporula]|uniref:RNA polymerase I associated factor, A49-like protein n=1 Tax=Trichodelitschia bisporula TaxID=703511 RepID=A0A6G1I7U9_9PEZI|nr:RNA polymerase I associated factor, A49-like protein [Trichodelitschia bisporula]
MGDKKRKRAVEAEGRPSKKAATIPAIDTVKIVFQKPRSELGPVIVSTPGFTASTDLALNTYRRIHEVRGSTRRSELLLHSSKHPRLDYLAKEELGGGTDAFLKHYVGVFNPKMGEVEVIEVPKLVLRSELRPHQDEIDAAQNAAKATLASQRKTLGLEFGTKKAKKAIASITENAIAPQGTSIEGVPKTALTAAVMESLAEVTAKMPTKEAHQAAADDAKPRPKANLQATTPAEVYPLEILVSKEELQALSVKNWQRAAETNEDVKTPSRYVSRRLYKLALSKDVRKLTLLKYVLVMLDFFGRLRIVKGGGRKLPPRDKLQGLDAADSLIEGIKRKFTSGSEMTKWHVDKFSMHVAAVTLLIDNFETDIHDIQEDLRIDHKQAAQYFSELGCKIAAMTEKERANYKLSKAEAGLHKMAKLRIPLEFPKQRVIPGKRR